MAILVFNGLSFPAMGRGALAAEAALAPESVRAVVDAAASEPVDVLVVRPLRSPADLEAHGGDAAAFVNRLQALAQIADARFQRGWTTYGYAYSPEYESDAFDKNAWIELPVFLHGTRKANVEHVARAARTMLGFVPMLTLPELLEQAAPAPLSGVPQVSVQIGGGVEPRMDCQLAGPGAPLWTMLHVSSKGVAATKGPGLPAMPTAADAPVVRGTVENLAATLHGRALHAYGDARFAANLRDAFAKRDPNIIARKEGDE